MSNKGQNFGGVVLCEWTQTRGCGTCRNTKGTRYQFIKLLEKVQQSSVFINLPPKGKMDDGEWGSHMGEVEEAVGELLFLRETGSKTSIRNKGTRGVLWFEGGRSRVVSWTLGRLTVLCRCSMMAALHSGPTWGQLAVGFKDDCWSVSLVFSIHDLPDQWQGMLGFIGWVLQVEHRERRVRHRVRQGQGAEDNKDVMS